jgi:ectoine hydroxylase-related dioxygenase (phytanoyl-CoA dioxygenase family)
MDLHCTLHLGSTWSKTMSSVRQPTGAFHVTDPQREQFERDGYFMTDVVFDEHTIAGVRAEFERIWAEMIEAAVKRGASEQERALIRYRPFMSQLDHKSQVCRDFIRHEVFQALAAELIGPDVDQTWNQAIIKAPQKSASVDTTFAWHQDQWYALNGDYAKSANLELLKAPDNAITCWVAISRTTVDNGTLWVLPGRHKEGLLPHVRDEKYNDWRGEFDTSWKVPAVMRAGQVLVFKKYLPHGSGPNISDEVRMAYQIGYTTRGLNLQPTKNASPLLRAGKLHPWDAKLPD